MSILKITRETKILIVVVICICAISFGIAFLYYNGINKSEDPRLLPSKFMFVRYDEWVRKKNYHHAFLVLDSIEQILKNTPGYADSYELGIVLNNRASVYISKALYETDDSLLKKSLLDTAFYYSGSCIDFYHKWTDRYGKLSKDEILETVKLYFSENDESLKNKNFIKIIQRRTDDIVLAQKEAARRLSVAYTNLGIIQRHQKKLKEAVESYEMAIRLWEDNPAALGNLNVMYGKPYKDRSFLKKMFPPDRDKP